MADMSCGRENFKPLQRTSFWKNESLCDEMFCFILFSLENDDMESLKRCVKLLLLITGLP